MRLRDGGMEIQENERQRQKERQKEREREGERERERMLEMKREMQFISKYLICFALTLSCIV